MKFYTPVYTALTDTSVYNEIDKCINMGNLRASNYKYNKEIFVPQSNSIDAETGHKTRRTMAQDGSKVAKNNFQVVIYTFYRNNDIFC